MNNNPLPRQRVRSLGTSPGLTSKSETAQGDRTMDAKHLSPTAKRCCILRHFTPREFEVVNADAPAIADSFESPEYVVIRAWNSRRTIEITNHDMLYADMTK